MKLRVVEYIMSRHYYRLSAKLLKRVSYACIPILCEQVMAFSWKLKYCRIGKTNLQLRHS